MSNPITKLNHDDAIRYVSDFTFEFDGSIALLWWQTISGRDWLNDNVDENAQKFGGAIVIEHRYVAPILEAIVNEGLTVISGSNS